MGGGGGGGTQVQSWEPGILQGAFEPMWEQAMQLGQQPYTANPYAQVADLNPAQIQAGQAITNLAAYGSPDVNATRQMLANTQLGAFQNPWSTANNPYLGNSTGWQSNPWADQTNPWLQGSGGFAMNPYATEANPYMGANVTPGLNPYLPQSNPYLDAMIGSAQGDLVDQYKRGIAAQTDAAATMGHVYGSTGYGDQTQQNQKQLLDALSGVEMQMRFPAYQQSSQLAEAALARDLAAQQFNVGQGAQLGESALSRATGAWDAERARQMAEFSNLAGLQQSGLNLGAQTWEAERARTLAEQQAQANLAETGINRALTGWEAERARQLQAAPLSYAGMQNELAALQAQLGVGGMLQGQEQNLLDNLSQNWAIAQSYPQQQYDNVLQALNQLTGRYGSNATTQMTNYSNPLASIGGLGLLGYGLMGG